MSKMFLKRVANILKTTKSDFYEEDYLVDDTVSYYSSCSVYHKIKADLKKKNTKITLKPINPLGKSKFDNITLSEISNSFGRNKSKHNIKLGNRKVSVYIFKNIYGGFRTIVSAHFFNKSLFNLRYEFLLKDEKEFEEISKLISLKYLNGNSIDIENEYLVDENNIVLSFTKEFNLILDYHNNSDIFSYASHLLDLEEINNQEKVFNRYKKLYKKL